MYLFDLLKTSNISSNAKPISNLSILFSTLPSKPFIISINSLSKSSHTFLLATCPSKYLLAIDIVLLTKLPSVFAKSVLVLSINSS